MLPTAKKDVASRNSAFYFITSSIFTVLIGGIDYFTGPDVVVVFLYFFPIYFVTWNVNLKAGIIATFVASFCDFLADFPQTTLTGILVWNTTVRLFVFFGFCYLLADRKRTETELRETENRLFQLLEALPVGVFVIDSKGRPFYANRAAAQILGQDPSPNIPPEERSKVFSAYRRGTNELYPAEALPVARALLGEKTFNDDIEIHREGRIIPLHIHSVPIYAQSGAIEFAIAAFTDVSEVRQIQEQLVKNQMSLEESVLFLKQKNQEIGYLNEMMDLLQSSSSDQEVYKIAARYIEKFLEDSAGALYMMKESRNLLEPKIAWGRHQNGMTLSPDDCWALRRAQTYLTPPGSSLRCNHVAADNMDTIGCVPMIAAGQIVGILHFSTIYSIEDLRKKESTLKALAEQVGMTLSNLRLRETLRAQAIRDPLTGLFNRRYLEETLERELNRAKRKDRPLSLIMLDVDHFKRFNDQYGHPAGDDLLKSFGKILMARGRRDDVICRYGGEEFLLILPECGMEDAGQIAEAIRLDAMTLWIQSAKSEPVVSISAGVASYPENGASSHTLIASADRALYQAKANGRNRVMFCTEFTG
jgi:diguanylate cyclase (GGDEF)-like protein/PAS domain S-box-containing protein